MATVEREREFNISADDMWKVIGEFGGLNKWATGIDGLELTDGGKTRNLTVMGGAKITERLLDEGDRSYTYSLDPGGALPVVDYKSTLSVEPKGDAQCLVRWRGDFKPAEGTPEEAATQIIGMVYDGGLDGMSKAVG